MTLAELMPFENAMRSLARRNVLPTALDSAGLRRLGAGFHRQNFTSAQTLLTGLLDQYKADVESLINPVTAQREDRITEQNPQGNVTTGLDPATARLRAKQLLQSYGYAPAAGEAGTIKDLSSNARINLVLKTNTETSQGAGALVQANDDAVREAFPCWELYRLEDKKVQRNWPARFRLCAQVVGDTDALRVLEQTGRMIARLDSPIWQALGDGEDGSDDTLGNPYPPFAYGSGMWTRLIPFVEAQELGFVTLDTKIESTLPDDLAQLFEVTA